MQRQLQVTYNILIFIHANDIIHPHSPFHVYIISIASDSAQAISVAPTPTHIWNMGRPQFFFTALFVLVVCTLFPIVVLGNKKAAIFNKIADTTRNVQADPVTTGASAFLNKAGRFSLEGFMDAFEDLTLKQWGTPKTTLDTELIGLMRDVFVQDKDHTRLMQDAWADPEILRTLMEDLPMFDVIKPLRALKEKETLTAKDVSKLANREKMNVANASMGDVDGKVN